MNQQRGSTTPSPNLENIITDRIYGDTSTFGSRCIETPKLEKQTIVHKAVECARRAPNSHLKLHNAILLPTRKEKF